MNKQEEATELIKPGSVIREGENHFITVTRIHYPESKNPVYEYWENGYYKETSFEYITAIVVGQKDCCEWLKQIDK